MKRGLLLIAALFVAMPAGAGSKVRYVGISEGTDPAGIAWIVTNWSTHVRSVGEHRMKGSLFRRGMGRVLAVEPGRRDLSLYYEDGSYHSPSETKITVDLVAGKTVYVYGGIDGGIRFNDVILDNPADAELPGRIDRILRDGGRVCAAFRCIRPQAL